MKNELIEEYATRYIVRYKKIYAKICRDIVYGKHKQEIIVQIMEEFELAQDEAVIDFMSCH